MAALTIDDIKSLAADRGFTVEPSPTSSQRVLISTLAGLIEPANGLASFSLPEALDYLQRVPPADGDVPAASAPEI